MNTWFYIALAMYLSNLIGYIALIPIVKRNRKHEQTINDLYEEQISMLKSSLKQEIAVETLYQLIIDLVGTKSSDIEIIKYNSHLGVWEVIYKHSENLQFENFRDLYEFIITETDEVNPYLLTGEELQRTIDKNREL